jgi:tetratricopeptide (TPR) repeat protein
MSSRSRLAAVAIGLVIGWWSGQAVAQTEELDALHQRILAMDRVDQTFEAIPKEYAAGIEARSGTDNADYATALDILVDLHVKLGRFAEAEPFARRALAIRETLLSSDHLEVARSLNSLALVLESQSKYEEAEHLVRRSLAIREKTLGPNNVQSAESANNLGVLLFRQGRNSQAEPYFRRALAILETAREKNEGRIAGALSGVASVLEAEQRSTESEPLYRRALAIAEPLLQQERALREKRKNDPTAPMPPSTLGSSNYFFSGGRDWASVLAGMRWRTAGHAANFRAISLERGDRLMGNLHMARIEYRALIQAAYRMGAHERAFQEEGFVSAQWVSMNEAARHIAAAGALWIRHR